MTISLPTTRSRAGLVMLVVAALGFGVLVQFRSSHLSRRMGDLGVFLRAAWAAKQGGSELYSVACDNGWHYCYPPLLAIAMIPLADAPAGQGGGGIIAYEWSVSLWYALNLGLLGWSMWAIRPARNGALAFLFCLLPIGSTLMKGQVNLLVLALICGFLASLARGRSLRSGLFLSAAICVKLFPAFLLIVPMMRRDGRCLLGCAAGLLVGLLLIPLAAFGPMQAVKSYGDFARVLVGPGLGVGDDRSRAAELLAVDATDNHCFRSILHCAQYPDRDTRPKTIAPAITALHWALGVAMTAATCIALRSQSTLLFGGALCVPMLLLSPVCHLHYFALLLPLAMSVQAARGDGFAAFAAVPLALGTLLEQLPGGELCRDLGLASYGATWLWGAAFLAARRPVAGIEERISPRRLARQGIAA